MKKYLTTTAIGIIALLTVTSTFAAGNASAKNSATYSNEKFITADNGTVVNDGNTTTAYDENGDWVYTIERCQADSLPLDIFKTIRGTYGNYYITGMEKVATPGSNPVFVVYMQDATTYKTVTISDAETTITQQFTKQ